MKANFSIDVNIKVDLTENSVNLLRSLFVPRGCAPTPVIPFEERPGVQIEEPKTAKAPAEKKPAKPVEETKAAEAPATPVEPQPGGRKIDIEDVRKALSEKVDKHRDEIKAKLTELGAPSVTKLDPAKYLEMYNFLSAL